MNKRIKYRTKDTGVGERGDSRFGCMENRCVCVCVWSAEKQSETSSHIYSSLHWCEQIVPSFDSQEESSEAERGAWDGLNGRRTRVLSYQMFYLE